MFESNKIKVLLFVIIALLVGLIYGFYTRDGK